MKMISRYLTVPLLAVASCLSLAVSVARADDDGVEGGQIEGTETLDVDILMTPTASAPAGSSIELSLEAEDDEGTTKAELKLETKGLPAGTYSVSVTLKSDGSTVALGTFTVDAQGEAEIEFSTNPEDSEEAPFPANFNPFDIATVSVSDANNVVLFTADLTNATAVKTMDLNASVRATPGPSDPSATGNAVLTAHASSGKTTGMLVLNGHGIPASTAMTLVINHANVKKVSSDKAGNVSISITPKGKNGAVARGITLFKVTSMSLHDKFGNVLLSFSF